MFHTSQEALQAGVYIRIQWHEATRSISTRSPMDEILVHPSIKLAGTHLYTWAEIGTVRVECHKHNTMSPARAQARTAQPGGKRT